MTREDVRKILAEEYARQGVTGIDVEPGQEQKQRAIGEAICAAVVRAHEIGRKECEIEMEAAGFKQS